MWFAAALYEVLDVFILIRSIRAVKGTDGDSRIQLEWHQFALRELFVFVAIFAVVSALARYLGPAIIASLDPADGNHTWLAMAVLGTFWAFLGGRVIRDAALRNGEL